MNNALHKRILESMVPMESAKKPRRDATLVDYDKCIICQGNSTKGLLKVQPSTISRLCAAMSARHAATYEKIYKDASSEMWVTDYAPMWHRKCRNWYTHKKSYMSLLKN